MKKRGVGACRSEKAERMFGLVYEMLIWIMLVWADLGVVLNDLEWRTSIVGRNYEAGIGKRGSLWKENYF